MRSVAYFTKQVNIILSKPSQNLKWLFNPSWFTLRLLHSPILVALGLSVGYETWPPIGWHHPFVIGWCKYRPGLPRVAMHCGFMWLVGISIVFGGHWQPPCTALTAGKCLPLALCKETVKESRLVSMVKLLVHSSRDTAPFCYKPVKLKANLINSLL